MYFEIVGEIADVATIARGPSLRERTRLVEQYGPGDWRKMKGVALVVLPNGESALAELHWYEAHGIGRRKLKIKRFLD